MRVCTASIALTFAASLVGGSAAAQEGAPTRTQINAGLRPGITGQGTGSLWPETLFFAGIHADAIFGRSSPRSFGYGPAIGASSSGFRDLTGTLGGSLLLPVHDYLPFVLSVGPTLRTHESLGTHPGVYGSLFWGSRSFNYTGTWGLTGGIVLEARKTLGGPNDHAVIVAAHPDLQVLTLPVAMIINAFR